MPKSIRLAGTVREEIVIKSDAPRRDRGCCVASGDCKAL